MGDKVLTKWPSCEHEVSRTLDEPGYALPWKVGDGSPYYWACKACHDKYVDSK